MSIAVMLTGRKPSAYELERAKNIQERTEKFKDFMFELGAQKQLFAKTMPVNNRLGMSIRKRRANREGEESFKMSKVVCRRSSPPRTRSRASSMGGSSSTFSPVPGDDVSRSTVIKFPFNKSSVASGDDDDVVTLDEESEEEDEMPVRKTTAVRRNFNASRLTERVILNVEDVTPRQLSLVVDAVRQKVYDPYQGTCCHQCRQKTKDQKTVCRADTCSGIRGQFCGVCLMNRYGEDARDALLDPKWTCPVCRDICNCSFCRPRKGRAPTGILVHQAKSLGYKSVMDYLTKVDV